MLKILVGVSIMWYSIRSNRVYDAAALFVLVFPFVFRCNPPKIWVKSFVVGSGPSYTFELVVASGVCAFNGLGGLA